jgi:uncharacterized protein YcfL
MKKALLILSLLAIALAACSKKDSNKENLETKVEVETYRLIENQFEYNATENIKVLVSEFVNSSGRECVTVHANYIYDSSNADIFCIPAEHKKIFNHDKNEVLKQFIYKAGTTPVQVTEIRTKKNNFCTIVHANYIYDSSKASITCDT